MRILILIIILFLISLLAFGIARGRALRLAHIVRLHSLPYYHGYFACLATLLPGLAVITVWSLLEAPLAFHLATIYLQDTASLAGMGSNLSASEIHNLIMDQGSKTINSALATVAQKYTSIRQTIFAAIAVVTVGIALGGLVFSWRRLTPDYRARNSVENVLKIFMAFCAALAVLTTIGIILSLLFESFRFFGYVPVAAFLFGLEWNPQIVTQTNQVNSTLGAFGAVPLFAGTLLVASIAMVVAIPIGLLAAIYTAEYAVSRFRTIAKPLLEILAGIPSIVYGFFAALTVAPTLRDAGAAFGVSISSESALAAGVVMGIMIIPFISSLTDDVISAVPKSLREGSLGLGATHSETIRRVVLPAALPGIVGGILLAASRAIGETMIVVMAAGLSAKLTANPFSAVTTVTVQIVALLIGDQEFDNPKTLAAFALGLVLFTTTLVLNVIALQVVRKYREQYE